MAKLTIADLKERVVDLQEYVAELEAENAWLQSKLTAFFTGNVPNSSSLDHVILAQWGRKRLAERVKQPALLVKKAT